MKFHALIFSGNNLPLKRILGPYRIAHFLREEGWDIEVCEWIQYWSLEELKEFSKSRITQDTKFIGFGGYMRYWDKHIQEFVDWLKLSWPELTIIYGGQVKPEMTSRNIDYYISGYAENALTVLLKYLFSNGNRSDVKLNLDWLARGKRILDANKDYPLALPKSLMVKYEDRDYITEDTWLGIEFSRGCKFQCIYCSHPILGLKEDTSRSQEDFLIQVKDAYDRFGVKNYFIADETFNDRVEKISKFADAVQTLDFQPFFHGFIRADLLVVRPQDRIELDRLNVRSHFYGIETFNKEAGKAIGKGFDPDRLKEGLLDVRKYFENNGNKLYKGQIAIIIGLPYESLDSFEQTRVWLENNWVDQSVEYAPLQISNNLMLDKPSLIDKNYEKYGYVKIEKPFQKPETNFFSNEVDVWDLAEVMNWKNEHLDFAQATQIADQYNYSGQSLFTLSGWVLDKSMVLKNKNLKEAIDLKINEEKRLDSVWENYIELLLKNYKNKKLK